MAKGAYIGIAKSLPSGYTQVEYLKSDGTQYIKTGFTANQNTRVIVDAMSTSDSGQYLFGAITNADSSSSPNFSVAWYNSVRGGAVYEFGTEKENFFTKISENTRVTVDANKNVCTLGSNEVTAYKTTFTCDYSLYLFALNYANRACDFFSGRIYSCQIFNNGTLVRDFVPCINSSGTAGLYDVVNSKFYTNAGSGTFDTGNAGNIGVARKVKALYVGVSGKARKVKKAYIGVGGVARLFWSADIVITAKYKGTTTSLTDGYGVAAASNSKYCVFGPGASESDGTVNITIGTAYGIAFNASLTTSKVTFTGRKCEYGAATAGDYAVFAGGYGVRSSMGIPGYLSNVEYVNASLTKSNGTALQKESRYAGAASVSGNAIFAGGAYNWSGSTISCHAKVTSYNSSMTKKDLTSMASNRLRVKGATASDDEKSVAIFSGGMNSSQKAITGRVAYNESLTQLSVAALSTAGYHYSGVTTGKHAVFTGSSAFAMDASLTQISALSSLTGTNWAQGIKEGYFITCNGTRSGTLYDSSFTATSLGGPGVGNLASINMKFGHGVIGQYVIFGGGEYQNSNNNGYYSTTGTWAYTWAQEA